MPVAHLLTRPCTIVRRTEGAATDDYGNAIPAVTQVETKCELQQRQRGEVAGHGDFSRTEWSIYLPPGTVIDTSDVVVVDGNEYEMDGEPWEVRNPRNGRASHVEASLRRAGA